MGSGLVGGPLTGSSGNTGSTIAPAGQSAILASPLGVGATDVVTKIGSTQLDAAVNAGAKLTSFRTGINGVETESLFILKGGVLGGGASAKLTLSDVGTAVLSWAAASSIGVGINIALASTGGYTTNFSGWAWSTLTGIDIFNGMARSFRSNQGANGGEVCIKSGSSIADGSTSPTAFLHQFITGSGGTEVIKAQVSTAGRLDQSGTDSTGTPGAATIDKATGKSSIAIGASSVTVTCNQVAAASRVMITPHARDATCKELIVVPGAGSFVVSGSAVATAALPFSWEVSTIL